MDSSLLIGLLASALIGGGLGAASVAWWGRQDSAFVTSPATSKDTLILAQADAGYYFYSPARGVEEFSPLLRYWFGLDDYAHQFERLQSLLAPKDYAALESAIRTENAAHSAPVELLVTMANDQRCFACSVTKIWQDGALHAVTVWFRDVTAHEERRQRLAREVEQTRTDFRKISAVLNSLPVPLWQRGEDLSIIYCNPAYGDVVEEAPERVMETSAFELHKNVKNLARQALQQGMPQTGRWHVVVNGERRLFAIAEHPLPNRQGTVGMAVDISELEQAEEALERHVAAQSDLLESSTNAMVIYGPDMRLHSYNAAFAALWRLDKNWLDTRPTFSEVLELLREKRKLPEQANFPAFKQQQLRFFRDLMEPQEDFYYLPDGRSLRVIVIPHALGGLLYAFEDVTDRLALERSYNTLMAVQKETLNRLNEGIAVFGEDGRLRLSNPTFAALWELDEMFLATEPHIGEVLDRARHFYQYDDWPSYREELLTFLQSRMMQQRRFERTNQTVIDWGMVPLPDGATLHTFTDVTASMMVERSLREKNEALETADRLKTEFLANVSYELRSPLTSISGFAEMLKQRYFGTLSDKQGEYVDGILHSAEQLGHLINNVLDLSSMDAGYLRLELKEFSVFHALNAVLALVKERARSAGIALQLLCPPKFGTMWADETRIKQVIYNLLSNAVKYTGKGGKVMLSVEERAGDQVAIIVDDSGVGIPVEDQQAVFGRFYRGTSLSAPKSGAGLGLPMVKSFIELHGGSVTLTSEPGKGTRVECILPRRAQQETRLSA